MLPLQIIWLDSGDAWESKQVPLLQYFVEEISGQGSAWGKDIVEDTSGQRSAWGDKRHGHYRTDTQATRDRHQRK
jgi:hypothetical protein